MRIAQRSVSPLMVFLGCGFVGLVFTFLFGGWVVLAAQREFHRTQYPGSRPIPPHNFYQINWSRQYIRIENAYQTRDDLFDVQVWYKREFDIANYQYLEDQGNDCFRTGKSMSDFNVKRRINIIMCDTPAGPTIYITRFISRH